MNGDTQYHGSFCAGIVLQVAPHAQLLIVQVAAPVLTPEGMRVQTSDQLIAAGVNWAVTNNADIISISYGAPVQQDATRLAIDAAIAANKMVFCAAANDGRRKMANINYPA